MSFSDRFDDDYHDDIGVDFAGGSPGTCPNNWETPMHLSLFTTFPPNILVFPPNIFDKSMPVHGDDDGDVDDNEGDDDDDDDYEEDDDDNDAVVAADDDDSGFLCVEFCRDAWRSRSEEAQGKRLQ